MKSKILVVLSALLLSACNEAVKDTGKMTMKEYETVIDNTEIIKHCDNASIVRKYKDKLIYISSLKIIDIPDGLDDPCKGTK